MQKILVIMGPTASGKSSLGIDLAEHFGGGNYRRLQVNLGLCVRNIRNVRYADGSS